MLVLGAGKLLGVGAAVASVRVMTSVLSPTEVGRYILLSTLAAAFVLTFLSPVLNYLNRRFSDWVAGRSVGRVLAWYVVLLLVAGVLCALASYALQAIGVLGVSIGPVPLLLCVVGIVVCQSSNYVLLLFLNLLGDRQLFALFTSLTLWIGIGASAALALTLHAVAETWIAGQIVGWTVIAVVALACLRPRIARAYAEQPARAIEAQSLWAFVWPLIISTGLYWFQVQGYRLVLGQWVSAGGIGLVATGLTVGANPLAIIDTLLGEYLHPPYYRGIGRWSRAEQEGAWSELASSFLVALVPVGILLGASGPFLAVLLLGPAFRDVTDLVAWGVFIEFLRAVLSLYNIAAYTCYQTRRTLGSAAVGVGLIAATLVPLARWNLYNGVGLSLALGMMGAVLSLAGFLRPSFSPRFPTRSVLRATAYSVPVLLLLVCLRLSLPHPTAIEALAVCAVAGAATLGVEAALARSRPPNGLSFTLPRRGNSIADSVSPPSS
jgi:hypothetical protein